MRCVWLLLVIAADPDQAASLRLDTVLATPVSLRWQQRSLQSGLEELAKTHQLDLVLDRRIDRDYTVFGDVADTPLEDALGMLVKLVGARAVVVGEALYIGPDERADRTATAHVLYQRSRPGLPKSLQEKLARRIDLAFDPARSVRQTLLPLIADLGLQTAEEQLPDVEGPVGEVTDVPTEDVLAVLLAQHDKSFAIDSQAGRFLVTALPEDPAYAATVRLPRARARSTARRYRELAGDMDVTVGGLDFTVRGRWSQHRAFLRGIDKLAKEPGRTAAPARPTAKTFTLSMRNVSLQTFAAKLAEVTGKAVRIDEASLRAAGKSKLDRLSCIVTNVTLEQLLERVLKPMALAYRIEAKEIVILAPPMAP